MKAAVLRDPAQPMLIEDVPTPEPKAGEVLVKVAACGVCHTDLHYLDHGTPTFKKPPIILGHEVSGTIAGLGAGVTAFKEADRVLLPAVLSCGSCEYCRIGRENICENSQMLGNHIDGGYAEYIAVPSRDVFRLPSDVPLVEGAVIADAVTTPYHAVVRRGKVTPGDWVVVVGCGGVGLTLVQIAAAVGARVIAIDVKGLKLEAAKRFGAAATINPLEVKRVDREVRALTGGGADVAFEAVGKAATQQLALDALKTGGRAVLVGYSPEALPLNAGRVMFRELEVVGSLGCRPVDYPRAIDLVRQGKVRLQELVTHRFALDDIHQALDTLRCGDAFRIVVTP